MSPLDLLAGEWTEALAYGLLHSVWQIAAVAGVLAIALAGLRSSRMRHAVACLALLAMLVLPVTTVALRGIRAPEPLVQGPALRAVLASTIDRPAADGTPRRDVVSPMDAREGTGPAGLPRSIAPWLTLVWALGVVVLSIRLAGGWIRARSLTRRTQPVPEAWSRLFERIGVRLGLGRAARLRVSPRISVPVAWGWLRPVVLLPASALTGMSSRELEGILAHELAHVRRHDYLVNLVQSLVETLLFYHPAVWWTSRRIRVEREHACDELAVRAVGDPVAYSRALASLERDRDPTPRAAVAATGGDLSARIRRITAPGVSPHRRGAGPLAAVLALSLVAGVLIAATRSVTPAPASGDSSRFEAPARTAVEGAREQIDLGFRRQIRERAAALVERDDVAGARRALGDEAWIARAAAARALGEMDDDASLPSLVGALADSSRQVREQAATALGFLGESRVEASLVDRLEDPAPRVREAAARALGQLNPTAAVAPLLRRLEDEDAGVRRAAAWSLGFLGDDRAAAALARAAERDPDERVRRASSNALLML